VVKECAPTSEGLLHRCSQLLQSASQPKMSKAMLVGVAGRNASGKTTVCEGLQKRGWKVLSLSDVIRYAVSRREGGFTASCSTVGLVKFTSGML
jgi:hypothetical protein